MLDKDIKNVKSDEHYISYLCHQVRKYFIAKVGQCIYKLSACVGLHLDYRMFMWICLHIYF